MMETQQKKKKERYPSWQGVRRNEETHRASTGPNVPPANSDKDVKYERRANGDLRNKRLIFPPQESEIIDIMMNVAL